MKKDEEEPGFDGLDDEDDDDIAEAEAEVEALLWPLEWGMMGSGGGGRRVLRNGALKHALRIKKESPAG